MIMETSVAETARKRAGIASKSLRTARDPFDEVADDFRRIGGWSRVHIAIALVFAACIALWQCTILRRCRVVRVDRRVRLIGYTPTPETTGTG